MIAQNSNEYSTTIRNTTENGSLQCFCLHDGKAFPINLHGVTRVQASMIFFIFDYSVDQMLYLDYENGSIFIIRDVQDENEQWYKTGIFFPYSDEAVLQINTRFD